MREQFVTVRCKLRFMTPFVFVAFFSCSPVYNGELLATPHRPSADSADGAAHTFIASRARQHLPA